MGYLMADSGAGGWIRMLIERLQERLWRGHVCVPFDVRQADPVECGELVAVLEIDGEEGTWPTLPKP
ncbi:hypothetical protein HAX54_030960, partial [Datura stramonium]|nr:hypothetical protein [Datura stramonium]